MNKNKAANMKFLLFALQVIMAFSVHELAAQTDSLYLNLDSTTFVTHRHTSSIKKVTTGVTQISLSKIQSMPKILGNTDPVNFIKNLPGVQTSSEYDSGLHIYGCDNAHNEISISGVPLYGVNHLFGFFSIFNPTHFDRMEFSKNAEGNHLGGGLKMELPDTLKKSVIGDFSIGIMSSQGTIGIKVGNKSHLRLSVRQSYMDLLYKRFLQIEGSPIRYGFGDYNASWISDLTDRDRIWVEVYYGHDRTSVSENKFTIDLDLDWCNYAGAFHWRRNGDEIRQHHTIFSSGFHSNSLMTQNKSSLSLDSYINTAGYRGDVRWKGFRGGCDIKYYDILPQSPESKGLYKVESDKQETQRALESSLSLGWKTTVWNCLGIDASLRGSFYLSPEMQYDLSMSPDLSVSYNAFHLGKITASYGWRHQYLFQAGMSNIGLPLEFWFAAGKYSQPQKAQHVDIAYDVDLFHNALSLSTSLYYKRLYNQVEYSGDIMDFFNSLYSLDSHLLKGDGWNYGANFMIHKQNGDITGWVSYSIGRALRRFDNDGYTGIYPASHERIHELNVVCSYNLKKWDFSGTFICASGTPFTAPEYYYLSSGQIIAKLGEHNACRMRPYIRLDLSVSYSFHKSADQENGINFSLYNATGRKNDVMYRLHAKNGSYSFSRMSFFLRWVPSVSYYHKF